MRSPGWPMLLLLLLPLLATEAGMVLAPMNTPTSGGGQRTPRAGVAAPARWEGLVLHLAATLRDTQVLSALHFLCRSEGRCASREALKRLGRSLTVPYTLHVGGSVPPSWPTTPSNLLVLVGFDCGALVDLSLNVRDVVLMVSSRPKEVFLSRAADAFETCWRDDLLNVLAVQSGGAVGGGLPVYTYQPYYPGHCLDMRPWLAAVWTPRTPHRPAALGLVDKDRNLAGCPLRVSTSRARPWIELIPTNDSSNFVVIGTYANLLYTVADYLNFTPVVFLPSDGHAYGNPNKHPDFGGLLGDIFHNRTDIGLFFSGADLQLPWHARPATAQITCTTWCLPTGYRVPLVWQPVVGEFSLEVWGAVLASYVVAILAYRFFLSRKTLTDTWLIALQGLISCIDRVPDRWAPRAFLFCWSFFGLVLATLYIAALNSINTTLTPNTVFRSLADMADSDLPLYAAVDYVKGYRRAQFDTDYERKIFSRLRSFPFEEAIPTYERLFFKRDIGLLIDRNSCLAYAIMFTPVGSSSVFHVLHGYCMSVSTAYNFATRHRSPLLRRLTKITARLDEGGLTKHWFDVKIHDFHHDPDPVLRVRHLLPFMRLLGIGLAAASVVFVLELLSRAAAKCLGRLWPRRPRPTAPRPEEQAPPATVPDHVDLTPAPDKRQRLLQELSRLADVEEVLFRHHSIVEYPAYLRRTAGAAHE